jgi:3-oxoacyl-[acyl-carrier protein] reductase
MINFKDKKVLITGATGGIGNNLVKKFYELGAKIVGTGTNEDKLNNLKKEFNGVQIQKFKLEEHDKIEEFVNSIDNKLDGIDILINNAGITLDNLYIR